MSRLAVVLLANYLFAARYGLFYVVLLPLCSSIDFLAGLGLMRFRAQAARRLLLGVSLALNLGLLVGSRHMLWVLGRFGGGAAHWDWVFPLGLSFYTLQALTYTIDLYRARRGRHPQSAGIPGLGNLLSHPAGRADHARGRSGGPVCPTAGARSRPKAAGRSF